MSDELIAWIDAVPGKMYVRELDRRINGAQFLFLRWEDGEHYRFNVLTVEGFTTFYIIRPLMKALREL